MRFIGLLLISFLLMAFSSYAYAQKQNQVLLYEPTSVGTYGQPATGTLIEGKLKAVEMGKFEKAIQEAIKTFENSMKDTCAKQMETSITVTAEGKWAVVGVAVTGSMSLIILNPKMSKNCGK